MIHTMNVPPPSVIEIISSKFEQNFVSSGCNQFFFCRLSSADTHPGYPPPYDDQDDELTSTPQKKKKFII